MLILGIVLLVVGAGLIYLVPDKLVRYAGGVCLILGIVLVLLGVLDAGDVNLEAD